MNSLKYPLNDISQFGELARRIRYHSILMIHNAKSSHIGSAFSMAELLAVLYGKFLKIDPANPSWDDRDRFILSKGHAAAALYAVLAERGFFPTDTLNTFYQNGSNLLGHASHINIPGVEVSTGSLGHGLPIACGMALAAKRDGKRFKIFALLSDGECDEGSIWEAVLFSQHHKLDNLVVIVDYNKIQSLGSVKEVLDLEPFADKWRSFGWNVQEIDGHNIKDIIDTLSRLPFESNRPSCIIAHTVKGKGVSFMENQLLWHYRSPDPVEFKKALAELEIKP